MIHRIITFVTFVFFSFFFQNSLIYIKERNKAPSDDHLCVLLINFLTNTIVLLTGLLNRRQVDQSTGEIGKT